MKSNKLLSLVSRLTTLRRAVPALAVALVLPAFAETPFVKLPPPVYGGMVRDYLHQAYDATNSAGVVVRRADDSRLLVTNATFNVRQGINYVISIPMVSAASDGVIGLRYGETATFGCLADGVFWSDLAVVRPTEPGFHRLDIVIGHDANGDGVADEYAAYVEALMKDYGFEGAFDPEADYNRDGVSNREHYLAGTYPFAGLTIGGEVIAEQPCTISSLMNVRNFAGADYFAISFNAVEEATYSVLALDDLADGWGNATVVASREQLNGGVGEDEHWAAETGEMTLYVPRDSKSRQKFYMLQVGW